MWPIQTGVCCVHAEMGEIRNRLGKLSTKAIKSHHMAQTMSTSALPAETEKAQVKASLFYIGSSALLKFKASLFYIGIFGLSWVT